MIATTMNLQLIIYNIFDNIIYVGFGTLFPDLEIIPHFCSLVLNLDHLFCC